MVSPVPLDPLGDEIWVSVRGNLDGPHLLRVHLGTGRWERLDLTTDSSFRPPERKAGTCGLAWHPEGLAVALWDRVLVVDPDRGRTLRTWSDRRFSDLHGIDVVDGATWVTSTNIDGVLRIDADGAVHDEWFAWGSASERLGEVDYRRLAKDETGLHDQHVNAVAVVQGRVVVSSLGPEPRRHRLARALRRIPGRGLRRRGAITVLGRDVARAVVAAGDGTHDVVAGPDGAVYATEFFTNRVCRVDLRTGARTAIALRGGDLDGHLTRGLLFDGEGGFWAGHSVRGGWAMERPSSRLRHYAGDGTWTGREVVLEGYVGPFCLLGARRPAA